MTTKPKEKTNKPGIDTGTGGINIDGLVYTLDTGLPDDQGGAITVWSDGDINVDNTIKDISKPTKERLGSYLSDLSKGKEGSAKSPNYYPIETPEPIDVKIDYNGYPALPSPSKNINQFNVNLPDGRSPSAKDLKIKRGKTISSTSLYQDGNTLLPGATGPTSPITPYVSAVLQTNRFNTEAKFSSATAKLKHKLELGKSSPGEEVTFKQLSQIGPNLSMRAGLELNSTNRQFNPSGTDAEISALIPGLSQIAISRVDQFLLNADDVLKNLVPDKDAKQISINPMGLSWGTLNNVNDQYSGISSLGMIALSTALVASIQVIVAALSLMFSLDGSKGKKHSSKDSIGRYSLGHYYYEQGSKNTSSVLGAASALGSGDMASLMGISPTNVTFVIALNAGTSAFFKRSDSNGFNAIIARTIIRSSLSIVDQLGKIGGNPINAAKQILNLVDVIKSSKLIAACNVFAQLGDAILSESESYIDKSVEGGKKISEIDAISDIFTNAVEKSRLNGSLKLAWSGNRSNALLLLPKNLVNTSIASKGLGHPNQQWFIENQQNHNGLVTNKIAKENRLEVEDVVEIESRLNAEYVPFYFHDLRTNEIIGFHAFLESLSDEFSANYDQSEGIGRVEAIKIYRSTQRKINLSFIIASTSLEDFDIMWIKINKLITLIYPQYTDGKLITSGEAKAKYTIRQPFTQLIGASPMIRLRVGDVVKTNYSRFNLAKLFGLGDPQFTIDGKQLKVDLGASKFKEVFLNPEGYKFIPLASHRYKQATQTLSSPIVSSTSEQASEFFCSGEKLVVVGQKLIKDSLGNHIIVGKLEINENILDDHKLYAKKWWGPDQEYQKNRFIDGVFEFPIEYLSLTKESLQKANDDSIVSENDEFSNALSTFMSTEENGGNIIAKSFKSVSGKGLAGFLDLLSLDWMLNTAPWETNVDRRAPKMCKVSISFSPIHDISPGLDSSGHNRAPVYPVGISAPSDDDGK